MQRRDGGFVDAVTGSAWALGVPAPTARQAAQSIHEALVRIAHRPPYGGADDRFNREWLVQVLALHPVLRVAVLAALHRLAPELRDVFLDMLGQVAPQAVAS